MKKLSDITGTEVTGLNACCPTNGLLPHARVKTNDFLLHLDASLFIMMKFARILEKKHKKNQ